MDAILTIIVLTVIVLAICKYRNRLPKLVGKATNERKNSMLQSMRSHYRTKDGLVTYTFEFVLMPGGEYRIYIVTNPDYGGRSSGAHETHRLSDGNRKYICWDGPIRTLEEAKAVAAAWGNGTQHYIKYGRFSV